MVENCDCSDGPFMSHTKETTRKFANHQRKTTNYNSGGRWLVRPPFRNIPASLGKELEHAATFVNSVLCCSRTRKSSGNLWPLEFITMVSTSLTRLFSCLWLVLVSENETEFTRASFPGCPCNSGAVADFPTRSSHKSVRAVAEKLDTLHKLGREQPWRIRQWPLTKASMYIVTDWDREICTRCCHFYGTTHVHVRLSVSHKTFISLLLEKTECKLYEHKWLTSNKLNHKTGSILRIRAAVSHEKPVNFYQNTWHCITEELVFKVSIVRTSNFIQ